MSIGQRISIPPLALGAGAEACDTGDLLIVIVKATDKQVGSKAIQDPAVRADFAISGDALNLHRVIWCCQEELGDRYDERIAGQLKTAICIFRDYDEDDFESALVSTKDRMRLPFGWTQLDLAWSRSERKPIRLLDPSLSGKRVPTGIANIAYQLQILQKNDAILLPIEQLRERLEFRKSVVSGAVMRLIDADVIICTNRSYSTGRAREYKFTGEEGIHYVMDPPAVDR